MELSYDELLDRAYGVLPERTAELARFEPPTAVIAIEGNKTIIRNFAAIAEKLRREQRHIARYLSKELAAPSIVEGGRCIFMTRLSDRAVGEKLGDYIKAFVVCSQCGKPDTKIVDLGRGLHVLICEACGARSAVPKL